MSAEDIAEWAARHFCAENVLLWMSGAPPDTLTLDLPSGGQRLATRHIDPVPSAWVSRDLKLQTTIRKTERTTR
ncbi:MAG TPA: hypothetical protein VFD47_00030 [Actinomycetota bacterium]|nr:hypothetical protein [Actinomycetota bacterium]